MTVDRNVPALIRRLRTVSAGEKAGSAAVALVNAIPYAGGIIASIIADVADQRRVEKICDVLSTLNDKLEESGANPTRHLTEDQIIETVHSTLREVTIASDKAQIEALKNGLAYAFLSSDPFERKQIFLAVLRDMTSVELAMFAAVYRSSDPYRMILRDPEESFRTDQLIPENKRLLHPIDIRPLDPVGTEPNCRAPLAQFLAEIAGLVRALGDAGLHRLDAKGLSAARAHLDERHCVVYRRRPLGVAHALYSSDHVVVASLEIKPSPLEASKTPFGEQFEAFVNEH